MLSFCMQSKGRCLLFTDIKGSVMCIFNKGHNGGCNYEFFSMMKLMYIANDGEGDDVEGDDDDDDDDDDDGFVLTERVAARPRSKPA